MTCVLETSAVTERAQRGLRGFRGTLQGALPVWMLLTPREVTFNVRLEEPEGAILARK